MLSYTLESLKVLSNTLNIFNNQHFQYKLLENINGDREQHLKQPGRTFI